jgi:hypothetical protein
MNGPVRDIRSGFESGDVEPSFERISTLVTHIVAWKSKWNLREADQDDDWIEWVGLGTVAKSILGITETSQHEFNLGPRPAMPDPGKHTWSSLAREILTPRRATDIYLSSLKGLEPGDDGLLFKQFDPTIHNVSKVEKEIVNELTRRVRAVLARHVDSIESHGLAVRHKYRETDRHMNWLVQWQVLGTPHRKIAEQSGVSRPAVAQAVKVAAKLIGLDLRSSRKV